MTDGNRQARIRATPRGMAFIWVIMTIAIIAALAAVAAPYLALANDDARYAETAQVLRAIGPAMASFQTAVADGQSKSVHNYPGQVSELTNVIVTGNRNSCQGAMTTLIPGRSSSDSISWYTSAPFGLTFMIPPIGLQLPIGTLLDSIPNRGPTPGTTPIYVLISGVSADDAAGFDAYIDNGLATNDTVTVLHAAVNDTTTLRFRVRSTQQVTNGIC